MTLRERAERVVENALDEVEVDREALIRWIADEFEEVADHAAEQARRSGLL